MFIDRFILHFILHFIVDFILHIQNLLMYLFFNLYLLKYPLIHFYLFKYQEIIYENIKLIYIKEKFIVIIINNNLNYLNTKQ